MWMEAGGGAAMSTPDPAPEPQAVMEQLLKDAAEAKASRLEELQAEVARLRDERDALAAAMPSEGADAALAYAVEHSRAEAAEARLATLISQMSSLTVVLEGI